MVDQVVTAGHNSAGVGDGEVAPADPAVPFQGAHRGHQDGGAGRQPALAGLDVHEFLEAQVRGESGLGDHVVGVAQGHPVGDDGTAAMGDVAEGTGVDDGRLALHRLHQVWHHGLMQQRHQRPGEAQLFNGNRLAFSGLAHHDA